MQQRYFRSSAAVYEGVRQQLDAAWGFPNPGTTGAFLPAADPCVPRDAAGRVYLAVHAEWCEWPDVSSVLPGLLASGAVEEVDRDAYTAALPA